MKLPAVSKGCRRRSQHANNFFLLLPLNSILMNTCIILCASWAYMGFNVMWLGLSSGSVKDQHYVALE
ncbi:uncharacterized protein BO88DRAFT_398104 [Aspergillus vadensis CBS 113365]|uniref:Uncharacterized protein n=1 Tax=Aspergillus vadensis (strain CBS 113365 / IMI 142717 / IBT 24658) TaxID=1448311 RepID=A0A319AXF8_ASPVC|nr:hypothetical protein BO88DRAFT_398104 [Aspergillus vadensis CBS 113365]PYH64091.1 hypothetical protein BO88DRAFT_398104 [Aspergillus vadensis CBS 113365]